MTTDSSESRIEIAQQQKRKENHVFLNYCFFLSFFKDATLFLLLLYLFYSSVTWKNPHVKRGERTAAVPSVNCLVANLIIEAKNRA
jgi:hypothetical protein